MLEQPGAYVHFPWCVKKCPYCDFNSHPLRSEDSFPAYADAVLADIGAQAIPRPFATVFLGGGTPSLFPPEQLSRVLDALPREVDAEVTMEANPGTTEYVAFERYRAAGVNRLSIGAQSFDEASLKRLGRIHDGDQIRAAYRRARAGGISNINLDLMYGLPGQNVAGALNDLDAAIALEPEHLSWYQLTLEPKTEFYRRPPVLPIDDVMAEIERAGRAKLAEAGYERYEVSAYAKSGYACRHNLNYWRFGDYLGFGAGAHGKRTASTETLRTEKPKQPRLYQANPTETQTRVVTDVVFEFMLNALRLVDGVDWETFERHTRCRRDQIAPLWDMLADDDLVVRERCATSARGFQVLDSVVGAFLE